MDTYTLPRPAFDLLIEAFGERVKAEIFAKAMEKVIEYIDIQAKDAIVEKKDYLKIELKEELKNELVTREIFNRETLATRKLFQKETVLTRKFFQKETVLTREIFEEKFKGVKERFKNLVKELDEKFKSLNFKLNIFLAIAFIALTFANPNFCDGNREGFWNKVEGKFLCQKN